MKARLNAKTLLLTLKSFLSVNLTFTNVIRKISAVEEIRTILKANEFAVSRSPNRSDLSSILIPRYEIKTLNPIIAARVATITSILFLPR